MKPWSQFAGIAILVWALLPATAGGGQGNEPAIEYTSLMNMRFYEATGGFLIEHLQLVFPPRNNPPMELIISKTSGQVVVTVPLRIERWPQFPVFDDLRPNGVPGVVQLGQPGDYLMMVKLGGRVITRLPFSLRLESSDDPFNPKKTFTRDGLWRTLAYLSLPIDRPDDGLRFNWWTCLREVPQGVKRPGCTAHLMRGRREVAASSPVVISRENWQFVSRRLVQPRSAGGGQNLTLARLSKQDGQYSMVIKVEGKPIKAYALRVKGGRLQRLGRCRLDTRPHTDFISPRLIDTSSGSGSSYRMLDAYWVEANPN